MEFNIEDIIKVTGAEILHKTNTDGEFKVSTDTRKISKDLGNIIYLPLRGENFDGHNFIDKAIENGAKGYFTQEKYKINKNADFVLYVQNKLIAYLKLAKHIREKITILIPSYGNRFYLTNLSNFVVKIRNLWYKI